MQKISNIKCKGSAILTALFIMILVAIAATAMSLRLQIDINRTQLIQNISQLKSMAMQGELRMINLLISNGLNYSKQVKENIDQPTSNSQKLSKNNIKISMSLIDLQGRFNLNNIKQTSQLKPLTLLLQNLLPKIKAQQAFLISIFTQEWVTKQNTHIVNISSQNFYQKQNPAYSPSHKPFISITEWRLVKDVTQTIFNALSPYISALPELTPLNLNSASKALLRTLGPGLSNHQASEIIKIRGKKGFKSLDEALKNPIIKSFKLSPKDLTLTSNYFLIKTHVSNKESQLILFTIVKRIINKKGVRVSVLQQTINTL